MPGFNYFTAVILVILFAVSCGSKHEYTGTTKQVGTATLQAAQPTLLLQMPRTHNQLTDSMLVQIVTYYRKEYLKDSVNMQLSSSDTIMEVSFIDASHDSAGTLFVAYVSLAKHINPVVPGDMNGDGVADMLFSVCTQGGGTGGMGTCWFDHFLFIAGAGGQYKLADVKNDGELLSGSGYFHPQQIDDKILTGIGNCYDNTDARCCPSIFYRVHVRLNDGQLKTIDKTPISRPAGFEW